MNVIANEDRSLVVVIFHLRAAYFSCFHLNDKLFFKKHTYSLGAKLGFVQLTV